MKNGVEVRCSACGQRNRLPFSKLGEPGKCGRCSATLQHRAEPVDVDRAQDLRAVIEGSSVPVVVDFWASWCGPCVAVAPEVSKVAAARAGQWLVVKANTERDPELGAAHGIRSIPTMAVFRGGHEVQRTSGARPASAIEAFVEQALAGG